MGTILNPNGSPYPDGNAKLLDTWKAIRDLGLHTAPASFISAGWSTTQNSPASGWGKLSLNDLYEQDEFSHFVLTAGYIVPKFNGWVEGWASFTMDSNQTGSRRQIGIGATQYGAPQVTTTAPVPADNLDYDLSVTGVFSVTNNQPVTVWSYQNTAGPLGVFGRQLSLRRIT